MAEQGFSLSQYLRQEHESRPQEVCADLVGFIETIARACKVISWMVNQGAVAGVLGAVGQENIQGEEVQKLDVLSHQVVLDVIGKSGYVAAIVSEESEEPIQAVSGAPFILAVDPLDGSSNINIDMCIGSIFSILPAPKGASKIMAEDCLQPGTNQLASCFCIYGPATILVLTVKNGSHGFTLDHQSGEFYLTHPYFKIEEQAKEFAINMSNWRFWEPPVRRYIRELLQGKEGPRGKDYNMRWIASFVAEVYRILVRSGVWTYPVDEKLKKRNLPGRLRLMYEANPMGLIVEQAGGLISTGREPILTLQPENVHQRVPIVLGSKEEVERFVQFHKEWDDGKWQEEPFLKILSM